jgi:hypothetical protein
MKTILIVVWRPMVSDTAPLTWKELHPDYSACDHYECNRFDPTGETCILSAPKEPDNE